MATSTRGGRGSPYVFAQQRFARDCSRARLLALLLGCAMHDQRPQRGVGGRIGVWPSACRLSARALALSRLCVCICVWWSVPAVRCGAVGCVGAWNLVTCARRVGCLRASVFRWTRLRRSPICVRAHRLSFSVLPSSVSLPLSFCLSLAGSVSLVVPLRWILWLALRRRRMHGRHRVHADDDTMVSASVGRPC